MANFFNQEKIDPVLRAFAEQADFIACISELLRATLQPLYEDIPCERVWQGYKGPSGTTWAHNDIVDAVGNGIHISTLNIQLARRFLDRDDLDAALKCIGNVPVPVLGETDKAMRKGETFAQKLARLSHEVKEDMKQRPSIPGDVRQECNEMLDSMQASTKMLITHAKSLQRLCDQQPGIGDKSR